jgi:DNA gyrase inhibitor GyrI
MDMYVVYDPIAGSYAGMGSYEVAAQLKREKGGNYQMYRLVPAGDSYEKAFTRLFNPQPKPESKKKGR